MHTAASFDIEFRESEFRHICKLIYNLCGINIADGKQKMLQARLHKRLNALGLKDYLEYIEYIDKDDSGREISALMDCVSTNLTFFFREPAHFDFLSKEIIGKCDPDANRKFRVWSAGCSSGEEPYSIAVNLLEHLDNIELYDVKVLATDISGKVLKQAKRGLYESEKMIGIPPGITSRYFTHFTGSETDCYEVTPALSSLIHFSRLNLMDAWPMRGGFDVVFCRNVMIYFDDRTRETLVNRFFDILRPGGYLFISHSETLIGMSHNFRYVKPAIYMKA